MKINTRQIRTDGKEKIRGENKYLEDLYFEDLHFARTLRSEISRGIIKEIIYPTIPDGYYIVDMGDKNNIIYYVNMDKIKNIMININDSRITDRIKKLI